MTKFSELIIAAAFVAVFFAAGDVWASGDDYDSVVAYIEGIRDDPPNAAVKGNPVHIAKWNRVLAALGENNGATAWAESVIHANAAKWPDSPWKRPSDLLKAQAAAAQQAPPPPPPESQTVEPPVQAQLQVPYDTLPAWLRDPNYVAHYWNGNAWETINFKADAEYTDVKGWGPWADLSYPLRQWSTNVYQPDGSMNFLPNSSLLDTESPGNWRQRGTATRRYREDELPGDGRVCIPGNTRAVCGYYEYTWEHAFGQFGEGTRATLGNARYEGAVYGRIHPLSVESAENPYGLSAPRIWFELDEQAEYLSAGISYAYRKYGDDVEAAPKHRSTQDFWKSINITSPEFFNDGLHGHFYNDGAHIAGTVQRPKIIGTFLVPKE